MRLAAPRWPARLPRVSESGSPHRRCIPRACRARAAIRSWSDWCPVAESSVSAATSDPGRFSTEKARLILLAAASTRLLRLRRTRKKRVKFSGLSSMSASQNLGAVVVGGRFAGDGRRMAVAQLHQLLHAARRVVKRKRLHLGMLGQKAPALRQARRDAKRRGRCRRRSRLRWRSGCGECAAALRAPP